MSKAQIVWLCVALGLMAIETMAPGAFMLWLGFAAAGVFLVVLLAPGLSVFWQCVLFVVLGFISVMAYIRFFRDAEKPSDQPLLNRRSEQLMDQVLVLESPIVNGVGRVKIGDAFWVVNGDDAPVGSKVRVVGAESMVLRVVAVA